MTKFVITIILFLCLSACQTTQIESIAPYISKTITLSSAESDPRLLVPVEIQNKRYWFLFDTGASVTVLDESIVPNETLKRSSPRRLVNTVADQIMLEDYSLEDASIGSINIPQKPTYISRLNAQNTEQIESITHGIVGTNTFINSIVHIHPKLKKLYVLRQLPNDTKSLGEKFDVELQEKGVPIIIGNIPNLGNIKMILDTGAMMSALQVDIFEDYIQKANARTADTIMNGASGSYHSKKSWLNTFKLGSYTHRDVEVTKTSQSLLGMDILSNYMITIDFPSKKIYLKSY